MISDHRELKVILMDVMITSPACLFCNFISMEFQGKLKVSTGEILGKLFFFKLRSSVNLLEINLRFIRGVTDIRRVLNRLRVKLETAFGYRKKKT